MASGLHQTLYVDYMSQPSRACIIFTRAAGLSGVALSPVLIHKGATQQAAYRRVNPLGQVPFYEEVDASGGVFRLPESGAIMSYLAARHGGVVADHWLPRGCARARARVEAAVSWYHANLRAGCARFMFNTVIAKRLGLPSNEFVARDGLQILRRSLKALEEVWLQSGAAAFVGGGSAPSIADLLMACELEQLTMLNKGKRSTGMQELLPPQQPAMPLPQDGRPSEEHPNPAQPLRPGRTCFPVHAPPAG